MVTHPDCDSFIDDLPGWNAALSDQEGMEVLLHRFLGVLKDMEPQVARRMRDEIASRFGGRFCSDATCAKMAELLNGYLSRGGERLNSFRPPG